MFTCDIAAQIFLDKSQLPCKDLTEPIFSLHHKNFFYKNKENGMSNVYNQLLGNF